MKQSFKYLFEDLFLPVLICRNTEKLPVVYMNKQARLLLAPTDSVEEVKGKNISHVFLDNLLRFKTEGEYTAFKKIIQKVGHIENYKSEIVPSGEGILQVSLSGVSISWNASGDYFTLYFVTEGSPIQDNYNKEISSMLNSLFFIDDVNASIDTILARAGQILNVSRVYVFEEISETTTRNTYEWCAPGVEPAIQDLQDLKKTDYNYDVIIESGMYITEDISSLPDRDREILEMQGIKALAIVTIYNNKKPLGYVGFDDCEKFRRWNHEEIFFLRGISAFISTLIVRKRNEEKIRNSLRVMQLISDTSEKIVYANSLDDYTLLFVNKALANTLNKQPEELIGKKCYQVIQKNMDKPCDFCPISKIEWNRKEEQSAIYTWEYYNTITEKTYLTQDSIVKWVDGTYAHVETAMDISKRVEYEAQLRYYASTDMMTGVANRQWGRTILSQKLCNREKGSLCFIDVDGLKLTNDKYGHAAGDEMLKQTVKILHRELSKDSFLCRWGGDEFLLWMNLPVEEAEKKLKDISEKLVLFNEFNKQTYTLSFSYGIIEFTNEENTTFDNIVTAADQRMYKNKLKKLKRIC